MAAESASRAGGGAARILVVYDDPASLVYCAALLGVGLVLFLVEHFTGGRHRSAEPQRDASIGGTGKPR